MAFNYTLETFIATPSLTDTKINIFDKNGTFKYSINPDLAYFFYKNNTIIINVDDAETITLDFETNAIAISALEKLNLAKKTLTSQISDAIEYYTKTELNAGQLNNLYYTSAQTDAVLLGYSETGHSHYVTGLTDVVVSGLTNNEVLAYLDGQWVNSSFTFDTSILTNNYYSIIQLSGSNSATTHVNWDNIINTPTGASGYGITDVYTMSEVYNTGQTYTISEIQNLYYTKIVIDGTYLTMANAAQIYSETGHSHYLSGLTDVAGGATQNQTIIYSAGTWTPATIEHIINNEYYTSAQTNIVLLGYSLTSHTHDQYSLTSHTHDQYSITSHTHDNRYYTEAESDAILLGYSETGHSHALSALTNTAHTHDDRYYTETETDNFLLGYSETGHTHALSALTNTAHTHDDRYYTETELDAGQLDNRYYTSAQTDANLLGYSVTSHTHNQYSLTSHTHDQYSITSHTHDDRYYTETETNDILLRKSDTGHTHAYSALTNTAHTHDDRYYTSAQTDTILSNYYTSAQTDALLDEKSDTGHTHDDRYYTKIYIEGTYYQQAELYTSAQTNILFEHYYTSAQTNTILQGFSTTAHTHSYSLSALTDVSFTGLSDGDLFIYINSGWTNTGLSFNNYYTKTELNNGQLDTRYYTETEIDAIFYTSAQTSALITGVTEFVDSNYSNTGHSHDFTSLTTTAHTHDERYYTETEFYANDPASGPGVLDNRYYTKILTYSRSEVDDLLSAITFSGVTGTFYTKNQIDSFLLGKSDTGHTHTLSGLTDTLIVSATTGEYLKYNGGFWVNSDITVDFGGYYTTAQTNELLLEYSLTSHTHDNRYYTTGETDAILLGYSETGHTHSFSALTNTAHTHADIYYTQTYINNNFYSKIQTYSQTEIDAMLLHYYTSAQTSSILLGYYTTAQTNANLLGYSVTGHSHYVTGLTDVVINSLTYQDVLVYSGGSWVNSGITVDLTNYYTKTEVDNLISGLTFDISGATALYELTDVNPSITGATSGEVLVYNGSIWTNSAITTDFSAYYTSAQTDAIFFTSAQTSAIFSETGHSHYLSGLTDVDSGATDGQFLQFSAGTWSPFTSPTLTGDFVNKSGDTMTGELTFSFMSNTSITERVMFLDTGGTIIEGATVVSFYITGATLLDYISGDTSWSGNTFIGDLSAFTLYDGQRYVDGTYFYEYLDSTLYRTYYADKLHIHDDRYYTQTELLIDGVLDGRYVNITDTANTTLVSLTDTDIDIYNLTNSDFLKYNTDSGWTNFYLDYTGLSYIYDTPSSATTVYGTSGLTGGGTLGINDKQIFIEHISGSTSLLSNAAGTPFVVANLTFDSLGHVATWQRTDLSTYFPTTLEALTDTTIVGKTNGDYIYYNSSTLKWENRQLTKSTITDFTETDYVHTTGTETITGLKTFSNDVLITANLTVSGTTTTISTEDLAIKDKIILLNSGETNYGVFGAIAGIEIDRGLYDNYFILYDEGSSMYSSGGTVKVGVTGDTKYIATREDNMTNNGIPIWVSGHSNITGYLDTNTSLTWVNGSLNIAGNVNITQNLYITGNTIITGTTTHIGDYDITGNLTVTGDTYLYGDLIIDDYFLSGVSNDTGLAENSPYLLATQYAIKTYVDAAADSGGTWVVGTGSYSMKANNDSGLVSVGDYSASLGSGTTAYGINSFAGGYFSIASGISSFDFSYHSSSNVDSGATGNYSAVLGGYDNWASGNYSAILGGYNNNILSTGTYSAIIGGHTNIVSSVRSIVLVGTSNTASGDYSAILGGTSNAATQTYSTVINGNGNTASGTYSVVLGGDSNTASGGYSTVINGFANTVSGAYSVIFGGGSNTVTGDFATASGNYTTASGDYSTASGLYTLSTGSRSMAINELSKAHGLNSFAGGYQSIASGITSFDFSYHNGANNYSGATADYSAILGGYNNNILSTGTHSFIGGGLNNIINGQYGFIAGGQGNLVSGVNSYAEGLNNTASSTYGSAHAEGDGNTASGNYGSAHVEGKNTYANADFNAAHAEGFGTRATGNYGSHAEGYNSISSGEATHSEGGFTLASGNYSHAQGFHTSATTNYSHAGGYYSKASGIAAFDHSWHDSSNNISGATANYSAILGGYDNIAEGESSIVLGGKGNRALGNYSSASGYKSIASNIYSSASGYKATASGYYSFAMGKEVTASGGYSFAIGEMTTASNYWSYAEGFNTTSSHYASHAEGDGSTASGYASHAENRETIASGDYSHTGGYWSIASATASFDHSYHSSSNVISGATADYSAILGGSNNYIKTNGISSAILAGTGHTINHARSIILGGYDITTDSDNTVFTPTLMNTGIRKNISTKTTGYTLTQFDEIIRVDGTSNAVDIILPLIETSNKGQTYTLKSKDVTNTCRILTHSANTFEDGDTGYTYSTSDELIQIVADLDSNQWVRID